MKHIRKYESFKQNQTEPLNEELIGEIIKAATGALKGFLTKIAAPFKSLKDDFMKGLSTEQAKTKFIQSLDTLLKTTTDQIQKAKDQVEIDTFTKGLTEQITELEKDFAKKLIKEGADQTPGAGGQVKNSMIAGKVMMGMVRDEFQKLKAEYDKRYKAAKGLPAQKQSAIQYIKESIEGAKKKLNDPKALETAIQTYKKENKIEGGSSAGISADILKTYGVTKSEELVGKEVRYKTKKYDTNKKPEEQPENVGKLKVLRVDPDGIFFDGEKEDFKKPFDQILPVITGQNEEKVKTVLTRLMGNEDKMGKVATYAEFVEKDENKDKVAEIDKIIGTQPTA